MSTRKKRQCPSCGSKDVVEIIYGLPGLELRDRSMRGEVALGGCCFSEDSPSLHCKACESDW